MADSCAKASKYDQLHDFAGSEGVDQEVPQLCVQRKPKVMFVLHSFQLAMRSNTPVNITAQTSCIARRCTAAIQTGVYDNSVKISRDKSSIMHAMHCVKALLHSVYVKLVTICKCKRITEINTAYSVCKAMT